MTSRVAPSRDISNSALWWGAAAFTAAVRSSKELTGVPSTESNTSPLTIPALAAAPPATTVLTIRPRSESILSAVADPGATGRNTAPMREPSCATRDGGVCRTDDRSINRILGRTVAAAKREKAPRAGEKSAHLTASRHYMNTIEQPHKVGNGGRFICGCLPFVNSTLAASRASTIFSPCPPARRRPPRSLSRTTAELLAKLGVTTSSRGRTGSPTMFLKA
jgi:hypothetical protein